MSTISAPSWTFGSRTKLASMENWTSTFVLTAPARSNRPDARSARVWTTTFRSTSTSQSPRATPWPLAASRSAWTSNLGTTRSKNWDLNGTISRVSSAWSKWALNLVRIPGITKWSLYPIQKVCLVPRCLIFQGFWETFHLLTLWGFINYTVLQ